MSGSGCRGGQINASLLIEAIAGNAEKSRGTAGQAALVLRETRDLATQENIASRRNAAAVNGVRIEGVRNRLFLKYLSVDYEFFNRGDQVFRGSTKL